jgi:transposase-like protein
LSVLSDLQSRGVEDIFIASIDGLSGFSEAIGSVFPQTQVQRCIIHQIRNSLKYVSWKDRKAFVADLKRIYRAGTREEAEMNLLRLGEAWSGQYAVAVRSWENNWEELATFLDYPAEIRRLIAVSMLTGHFQQCRGLQSSTAQGDQE